MSAEPGNHRAPGPGERIPMLSQPPRPFSDLVPKSSATATSSSISLADSWPSQGRYSSVVSSPLLTSLVGTAGPDASTHPVETGVFLPISYCSSFNASGRPLQYQHGQMMSYYPAPQSQEVRPVHPAYHLAGKACPEYTSTPSSSADSNKERRYSLQQRP